MPPQTRRQASCPHSRCAAYAAPPPGQVFHSSRMAHAALAVEVGCNAAEQKRWGRRWFVFSAVRGRAVVQVAYGTTVAIRFVNNVIGGENFIDMARFFGVQ